MENQNVNKAEFETWLMDEALAVYLDRSVTMVKYQETGRESDKQEWIKEVELFNQICKVGAKYVGVTPIEYCAKVYEIVKAQGMINLFPM